jgi:hypothetical protein
VVEMKGGVMETVVAILLYVGVLLSPDYSGVPDMDCRNDHAGDMPRIVVAACEAAKGGG